jgi:hypothetical protein
VLDGIDRRWGWKPTWLPERALSPELTIFNLRNYVPDRGFGLPLAFSMPRTE